MRLLTAGITAAVVAALIAGCGTSSASATGSSGSQPASSSTASTPAAVRPPTASAYPNTFTGTNWPTGKWYSPTEAMWLKFDKNGFAQLQFGSKTVWMAFENENQSGVFDGHVLNSKSTAFHIGGLVSLQWVDQRWLYFNPNGSAQPTMFFKNHSLAPYPGTWVSTNNRLAVTNDASGSLVRTLSRTDCPVKMSATARQCFVTLLFQLRSLGKTQAAFKVSNSWVTVDLHALDFGFYKDQIISVSPTAHNVLSIKLPNSRAGSPLFRVCMSGSPEAKSGACSN